MITSGYHSVQQRKYLGKPADFANQKGVTTAQISFACMLHKKDFIVPISGSRKPERIQENLKAADVDLTDNEFN